MLINPVIYDLDTPVSSLNVTLQGSGGDLDVSGFIYSPEGGIFSSGAIDGGYSWEYKFILMSSSEEFKIKSFDSIGNTSEEVSKNISYVLNPPLILSPGIPKILTESISSTGSSFDKFQTLNGNFINDGVIPGDYLLGTSGKNTNSLKKILEVKEKFLITELLPNSWKENDSIKIYSNKDRPKYKANKLKLKLNGKINSSAQKVLYTTEDNFDPIKIYANLTEEYSINSSNNLLRIVANGQDETIILTEGNNRTAQSIVGEINSYFNFTVAYLEQIGPNLPFIFFIQANTLKIFNTSASNYFQICKGDFLFAKQIPIQGNVVNIGKCEVILNINANRNLNLNIDDINLQLTLPVNNSITPSQIAQELNAQAGKCVASPGPNGLTLIAENNLNVLNNVDFLNLKTSQTGLADLNKSEDSEDSEWNLSLEIFDNNLKCSFAALDAFGELTDLSDQEIEYKISPPTFTEETEQEIENNTINCEARLPVEENVLTLSGNFDTEGVGVLINGNSIFTQQDTWTVDLTDLAVGDNEIILNTVDKFGTPSDDLVLKIPRTDPRNQDADQDPEEALAWDFSNNIGGASAENIRSNIKAVQNFLKPFTDILVGVKNLLVIARVFIQENITPFVNKIRKEIQKFIDDVVGVIKDLANGAGIYLISTIPKPSEVKNYQDFLNRLRTGGSNQGNYLTSSGGAFDGFVESLISSFDDPFDPNRPQFSENVVAGGYSLAIADTNDALSSFLRSLNQLVSIFSRELIDLSFSAPKNIRISNENKRVVLTWDSGTGFRPGRYLVLRSTQPGGLPQNTNVKTNILKRNASRFKVEEKIDKKTGKLVVSYDVIGIVNYNSLDSSKYENLDINDNRLETEIKAMAAVGSFISSGLNKFRFIDGKASSLDRKQKQLVDSLFRGPQEFSNFIDNTAGPVNASANRGTRTFSVTKKFDSAIQFFDSIRDGFLYQQESSEIDLENGKTYFYKIVCDNEEKILKVGDVLYSDKDSKILDSAGFELVGTPSNIELVYVEEELFDQFDSPSAPELKGQLYKLKGSVFNRDEAVINGTGLTVLVDNQEVTPEKIYYDKGIFLLKDTNIPKFSVTAKYWTKKEINTTRPMLVGKNKGNFIFRKDDFSSKTLTLMVGNSSSGASLAEELANIGSKKGFTSASEVSRLLSKTQDLGVAAQVVTFVRDFGQADQIELTADEVASLIREQTFGVRVSVDKNNRIVLMADINPDPFFGSKIMILSANTVLGFEANQTSSVKVFGYPPNWSRISMLDLFPILGDISRYIEENSQNFLKSLEDASKAIVDFIETLIRKVEMLQDIIKRLEELITSLVNLLSFEAGFWYLRIPAKPGGNFYLKESLRKSINRPNSDFAAGVLLVYGDGGTKRVMDLIFNPNEGNT